MKRRAERVAVLLLAVLGFLVTTAWFAFAATADVTQDQDSSCVGDPVAFVVTTGVRATGVRASASLTVTDGPDTGSPVVLTENPPFTGSFNRYTAGTDTFQASAVSSGIQVAIAASTVRHEWIATSIRPTADSSTLIVEQTSTISATLTCAPAGSVDMRVVSGPNTGTVLKVTGAGSRYTASYTGSGGVGQDIIKASFSPSDDRFGGATGQTTQTWTDHTRSVSLGANPTTASCPGDAVSVTASVKLDATSANDVPVTFSDERPGAPTQTAPGVSRGGTASATFRRDSSGTDVITATGLFPNGEDFPVSVASPPLTHVWDDCRVAVALSPDGEGSTTGSSFSEVAAVTYRGGTPAGTPVTFNATADGVPLPVLTATTDSSGHATVNLDCQHAGLITLTANATVEGRPGISPSVTHRCTEPSGPSTPPGPSAAQALTLTLAPSGTESLTGSTVTFRALLSQEGAPVAGATVTFTAKLPGQPNASTTQPTDDLGTAAFPLGRPVPGTDTVTARAVKDGRTIQVQVLHFWRSVPGLVLTLVPDGTSSEVGEEYTATLSATTGGRPVKAAAVRFSATMAEADPVNSTTSTTPQGHAALQYTRQVAGLDTVVADLTLVGGQHGQVSVTHLWHKGAMVGSPAPTLDIDRGSTVPGGPLTARGSGCPASARVALSVGNATVGTASADAQGRYSTQVRTPAGRAGRYALNATCGGRTATTRVDLVVQTSHNGTSRAATSTTAAVLLFFVLLGGQLLRPSAAAVPNTPTT